MNRKPRNKQRPTLKVYLPPDLHQSLEAKSNASGLSKSEIMRRLVRNDLNKSLHDLYALHGESLSERV